MSLPSRTSGPISSTLDTTGLQRTEAPRHTEPGPASGAALSGGPYPASRSASAGPQASPPAPRKASPQAKQRLQAVLDRFQTAIHQSSDTAADKARVFDNTVTLNRVRAQQMPAFGAGPMQVIETGQSSVLGFTRSSDKQKVLVLANFSEEAKTIGPDRPAQPGRGTAPGAGVRY
jgi:glycosidase